MRGRVRWGFGGGCKEARNHLLFLLSHDLIVCYFDSRRRGGLYVLIYCVVDTENERAVGGFWRAIYDGHRVCMYECSS